MVTREGEEIILANGKLIIRKIINHKEFEFLPACSFLAFKVTGTSKHLH